MLLSSFFDKYLSTTTAAAEGRWRRLVLESRSGRAAGTGHRNRLPPRRRAPSADAQADVVQAAEERATTVDDAAAWSNVALANGTEVP